MGTSSSYYGVRGAAREKFAQVPVRPPVIIEIDSGMMRDVREDHYPGDERNLHGHVRCRVEASGSARHVARTRKDAPRNVRSDGPSLQHETADAGPIFADLRQNDQRSVQQIG